MAIPLRSAGPQASGARARRGPGLTVVRRARRLSAVFVAIVIVIVIGAMLGAAVFHTQLAQRQLTIDDLDSRVANERDRFDELRRDRAVLRSPQRIADEAVRLGMVTGETSEFIAIDPMSLARQIAAAGVMDEDPARIITDTDPLDQFRDVKSVSAGQP